MIPAGLVLAGGRSRRMGSDKALLELDGERLIDRAVRLLSTCCDDVAVASGDARRIDRLAVPQVGDESPDSGPLGGILAGLRWAGTVPLAVVAVDAPHLDVAVLELCHELLGDRVAAVPEVDGRLQPLHAVWNGATVATVATAYQAGVRSPSRLLQTGLTRVVGPGEWRTVARAGGRFAASWNRPEDRDGREAGERSPT